MITEAILGLVGTILAGTVASARKQHGHLRAQVGRHETGLHVLDARFEALNTRIDAMDTLAARRHEETREDLHEVMRDVRSLRDVLAVAIPPAARR